MLFLDSVHPRHFLIWHVHLEFLGLVLSWTNDCRGKSGFVSSKYRLRHDTCRRLLMSSKTRLRGLPTKCTWLVTLVVISSVITLPDIFIITTSRIIRIDVIFQAVVEDGFASKFDATSLLDIKRLQSQLFSLLHRARDVAIAHAFIYRLLLEFVIGIHLRCSTSTSDIIELRFYEIIDTTFLGPELC